MTTHDLASLVKNYFAAMDKLKAVGVMVQEAQTDEDGSITDALYVATITAADARRALLNAASDVLDTSTDPVC